MADRYTDEYRREAAGYVLNGGKAVKDCAAELGLNDKTPSRWVSKFKKEGRTGSGMTADIAVSALEMAGGRGHAAGGATFHSDRGSRHTSKILARWAREHGVRPSVGRAGSCHDSAVAGSFFGSLKNERYSRFTFKARAEARMSAIWYMESLYNRMRPHSGVGWRKPAESMEDFFTRFYAGREEVKRAA